MQPAFFLYSRMFFILSKIFIFLLSPGFWIVTLLLWSFYTRHERRKKRLRILCLGLFIIFTNPFLFNVLVTRWQVNTPSLPPNKTYSAAILLGGITSLDKNDNSYFGPDADRFIQTTKLYHSGIVTHIAVTGGSPAIFKKRRSEADQIREALLKQGIPDSVIIVENVAINTFENATFIKRKLDSLKLSPPYILVTSSMHVPRATAVFNKACVQVIGYPASFKQLNYRWGFFNYFIPSINLLSEWPSFLKEVFGFAIYRMTGTA
jgi:uncharacterized SAM-binding protein YcdF (DUF218 family)